MRTTENAVKALVEVDTGVSVVQYIEFASEIIEEICTPLGYTSTRLEMIERWLAAHFTAINYRVTTSESAGGISESYWSSAGMCLDLTPYGQQAKLLDTLGGLAKLDKDTKAGTKSSASLTWVGTTEDEAEL